MILKQVLVEERNELDQCTLSNVEDGSMITQYGIMEIVQLVPDRVNLTPTQVKLLEEFG
jgi:hypothetical protein